MRSAIAMMGRALGPDILVRCRALFDAEQSALAAQVPALARNLEYGPDPRHRLDLYGQPGGAPKPIVLFVHGGGFVMGDKGDAGSWVNANVARMATQAGFLGAAMNYRLAPDHQWPAGAEDVARAVQWLQASCADHGGDPQRIVLCGTSAGAVHIAGYLALDDQDAPPVAGAVLLSGFYGFTPLDARDERYFGDTSLYSSRMPREAITATRLPLFIAAAQFDPPRFQAEFLGLMQARLERSGAMPCGAIVAGHNHYTTTMHLGTGDRRLADEILAFVKDIT